LSLIALATLSATAAWQAQNWHFGAQLERQARLHGDTLNEITLAAAATQRAEQGKRLLVETRLQRQDQIHHQELTDARTNQSRLRGSLATAELRLSVLLDAASAGNQCGMSTATDARGVVHGGQRAQLDRAHAQRIVSITDDGDQGLIALAACQAYAKTVSTPK
jgi:hypothetical protein